jgi:hypothetical protein
VKNRKIEEKKFRDKKKKIVAVDGNELVASRVRIEHLHHYATRMT